MTPYLWGRDLCCLSLGTRFVLHEMTVVNLENGEPFERHARIKDASITLDEPGRSLEVRLADKPGPPTIALGGSSRRLCVSM